jgi:hypothetical protein
MGPGVSLIELFSLHGGKNKLKRFALARFFQASLIFERVTGTCC